VGGSTTCRIMGAKKRFSQHSILNLFAVNIKNAVRSVENKWAMDLFPKINTLKSGFFSLEPKSTDSYVLSIGHLQRSKQHVFEVPTGKDLKMFSTRTGTSYLPL
jgi:hypothetical protein